eukprot:TRINITY_DN39776_c0_g1_i1.p1 TRINITY_DN39776_c0_g1~~TRINITY_DN39776_c0_g1_i1.p1  ORF type:complete len:174 (+),score=55.01 TRINITY_DN39776_c0_g1_i1:114-635(+)
MFFFFLMIRRPPRSTLSSSSAASDVYKRQEFSPPPPRRGSSSLRPSQSPAQRRPGERPVSPQAKSPPPIEMRRRVEMLQRVFREFDRDRAGQISPDELLQVGRLRRKVGHKSGEWTEEQNLRLVRQMDASGDGVVEEKEFVGFMNSGLPRDMKQFSAIVQEYIEAAMAFSDDP